MRITRLKLVNFIGIKHGTGLNEIEINIPKTDNKIVLLAGENGSGKSTILSALHPFKESLYDGRSKIILDDMEGRKEIDIESNGHFYEIVHIYAKAAQSFFKKDGEELNDNGGVKTCEQLIQKELGVKKDFFRISKIGSNTEGFVDLAPTDRKNFIGTFLNIDDIISKYKIVNDKMSNLNKEIKSLTNELGKYDDKEIIQSRIDAANERNNSSKDTERNLYKFQGSLTANIKNADDLLGSRSLSGLQEQAAGISANLASNQKIIDDLKKELIKLENPEAYRNKLDEEINKIKRNIETNNIMKKNAFNLYSENKRKVETLTMEMNSLGNPDDLENITKAIEEESKKIEELKEKIKSNPCGNLMKAFITEKKDVNKYLSKFQDFTDFVEKYFNELSKNELSLTRINLEYFFDENFKDTFDRLAAESRKAIADKQALKEQLIKSKNTLESFLNQLENLKKRPAECQINTCPFIREALQYKDAPEQIAEKEKEIETAKQDIEILMTKSENLQNLSSLYKYFIQNYTALMPRQNIIYQEFIKDKTLVEWLKCPLNEFQRIRQEIITNMSIANTDVIECVELMNKKAVDEKYKKTLEDSDSSLRDKYKKDIAEAKDIYLKEKENYDNYDKLAKEYIAKQTVRTELRDKYNSYIIATANVEKYAKDFELANKEIQEVSKLLGDKYDNEKQFRSNEEVIAGIQEEIRRNDAEILRDSTAIAQIDNLNDRLESLNETYNPIISVQNALNPSKGIPLIFMQNYLEETESITNDLLSLVYGDKFKIKFITTAKEFNIQVETDKDIKPDIKVTSQGETALTTVSISLALIEQAIGDYNILCLDELDGPLSKRNREAFIDILNKQISKLGIEQMFIISHNDAFDVAPIDLILLKENGIDRDNEMFMMNKNIIFDIERKDNE